MPDNEDYVLPEGFEVDDLKESDIAPEGDDMDCDGDYWEVTPDAAHLGEEF